MIRFPAFAGRRHNPILELPEEISGEYLSLLIAIQEDPFSTIDELARKTGASKPTVAKRLRELQEKK